MNKSLTDNLAAPYFKGIDGIRALAVMLVILYHVDFEPITGGYIGVDVFFVISGFLITRLILRDANSEKFSFLKFYARRIRRLFPALFITCLATFLYAVLFLSPYQLSFISKTTLAATASLSNFIFVPESGYFAPFAPKNPLLHTWSLGVEEQFYLLWPVVLIALRQFLKRYLFIIVAAMWVLSFLASISLIHVNENAVFFLTPFRIWEFATGALLILLPRQKNIWGDILVLAGCAVIIYCATSYDKKTLFPGLNALAPCAGAAAMIVGSGSKISGFIFEIRLIKYIGKISYSLYLVHWPLIVFWFYSYKEISPNQAILLVALTFVLGMVLHHSVEVRFRYKSGRFDIFSKPTAIFGAVALSLTTVASAHAFATYGWTWRADANVRSLLVKKDLRKILRHNACFLARNQTLSDMPRYCYETSGAKKSVLIVGTSRAADLYIGIEKEFLDWNVSQITAGNCYPVITIETPEHCLEINTFIFDDLVANNKYDLVVLGGLFEKHVREDWEKTAAIFEKHGVDYIVMGPRRHYKMDPHTMVWDYNKLEGLDQHVQAQGIYRVDFGNFIGEDDHYFSINNLLCTSQTQCLWQVDDALLYNDQTHFSEAGSSFIAKNLKSWYEKTR